MRICTLFVISTLLFILLLFAIFLLAPFPIALFPLIVKSQVYLKQQSDGQYTKATYFWSKLPAYEYYEFYFFNITNPHEVEYNGEQAKVVEVGPYTYIEQEFKSDIDFFNNDNEVYYRNNKSWVFSPARSCKTCLYSDSITVSNPSFMSLVHMPVGQNVSGVVYTILDIFGLLTGEGPTRNVPMAGITFESYPDPIISFLNSQFVKIVLGILNLPASVLPPVTAMGYFPLYNQTSDGNYTIKTGKDTTDNLALIEKWCGSAQVPWWGDDYSRDISNSGDGTFQKPQLSKSDKVKLFISYSCRAYYLHYDSDETVRGLKTQRFKMDTDAYDTTMEKNKGYRYENYEKADYFPNWPCGPNHTYNPNAVGCAQIDCSLRNFWCNECCDGTHYNNTVFLPPGIVPLRCLPGKTDLLPFAGFLSPPHFLWSPPEVTSSVYGLNPDENKHYPASFAISPLTGSTVDANFRMQLSVPLYFNKAFTQLSNINSTFLPSFWLDLGVSMKDYAVDYLIFNTVTIPQIILGIGIGLLVLSVLSALLLIFCFVRRRRQNARKIEITEEVSKEAKNEESWAL